MAGGSSANARRRSFEPNAPSKLHGSRDTAVPFNGERYSTRLRCFLRDVRTIPGAAPGSRIVIKELPGFPHRWTVPGDQVDATKEFWSFAGM